jgi:hypothetical protein
VNGTSEVVVGSMHEGASDAGRINHTNSNREGDGEKRTAQKARSTLGAESMHGTPRGSLPATLGVSIGRIK